MLTIWKSISYHTLQGTGLNKVTAGANTRPSWPQKEGLSPLSLGLSRQPGWLAGPPLRSDHSTSVGYRDSAQVWRCKGKWQKRTFSGFFDAPGNALRSWDSVLYLIFTLSLLPAAELSTELFHSTAFNFWTLYERVREIKSSNQAAC